MKTYAKNGQMSTRKAPVGKSVSEQSLEFGETAQLPGGVGPDRKFTRDYVPGDKTPPGSMIPPGMLNYR
jgi:hypothetical protein